MTDIETSTESLTETVRRLAALVVEHGLSELTVEDGDFTIRIQGAVSAPPAVMSVPAHPNPMTPPPAYSQTPVTTPTPARPSNRIALESPMVGVFYRSPSPEDPPFVHVGDVISVGQTIGLIEAMKVYSEVPSEIGGRIVEFPAENGKLVQQGESLLVVEPA